MREVLRWLQTKRDHYGQIVPMVTALLLLTGLALLLGVVYALFIAIIYLDTYLILIVTFLILLMIIYTHRSRP